MPVSSSKAGQMASGRGGYHMPLEHGGRRRKSSQCELITVSMCRDIGYNKTDVSLSPAGIDVQSEADSQLRDFNLLLDTKCSDELKLLLCSIYTPICMPSYDSFLPPCRFICERARNGCAPLMQRYKHDWPELFNCERFPRYSTADDSQLCLHFNRTATPSPKQSQQPDAAKPTGGDDESNDPATANGKSNNSPAAESSDPKSDSSETDDDSGDSNATEMLDHEEPTVSEQCRCSCSSPLVPVGPHDPIFNQVATGGVFNCAIPCKSPYFSEEKRQFAESWLTAWSVVCFTITLITVSTFLIDTTRFKYPERPIIFLSTCYMFVSVGFIIRIVAGHEAVACGGHGKHVLYRTTGPFFCSAVFLLTYFFGMAGAIWWVVLSLTWFLAAGLKWGSEAIAKHSQYYHAAAWLIPALKSILVLAMSSVDGDALSGICYVGNQSLTNLRVFVIIPLVIYLGIGGLYLILGVMNLFRIRKTIKKVGKKTRTLEKLIGRIGLFSLLYMVPSVALVACYFYELQNRGKWSYSLSCSSPNHLGCQRTVARPEFTVFIVKYSMTLLIGITNGAWICSGKTIVSWKKFYRRCVSCACGDQIFPFFWRQKMKRAGPGVTAPDGSSVNSMTPSSQKPNPAWNHPSSRQDCIVGAEGTGYTYGAELEGGAEFTETGHHHHKLSPSSRHHHHQQQKYKLTCAPCNTAATDSSESQQLTSLYTDVNNDDVSRQLIAWDPHSCSVPNNRPGPMCPTAGTLCKQLPYSGTFPVTGSRTVRAMNHSPCSLDSHPCYVMCDGAAAPLLDSNCGPHRPTSMFNDEESRSRVQHIHHHHHHHRLPKCSCKHQQHQSLSRSKTQKKRHNSHEP